ncbi:MAG: hypothetical protein P8L18_16060 [Verrucomicrobiota bacterium]|jgi:hypothetical protein|nr:hypothetical protein [Verrucomicrobiota bacterium]
MKRLLTISIVASMLSVFVCLVLADEIGREIRPPKLKVDASYVLREGAGRELVVANCMPCHSTAIVAANHMSRKGWSDTIRTMREQNGMWPLAPEIERQILDYLEKAQRVEDAGLESGKQSPWASPLYRPNPIWE